MRLFGWWHRGAAPAGRHARVLPVVTVPGAAASIVGSALRDPLVTGRGLPEQEPFEAPAPPAPRPEAAPTAVGLVFADGDSVQLAEDDPRVRTFRAAAEALLEHTAS
jgi:hypothetical protein